MEISETTQPTERTFTLELTEAEILQVVASLGVAKPVERDDWLYCRNFKAQERILNNRVCDALYEQIGKTLGIVGFPSYAYR